MDLGDLGDLSNARGNRQAREEAAAHAQQTQAGLDQIQRSLNEQHSTQKREKIHGDVLFQLSLELDEDLRVITDEPTEEAAMRIANRYLRNPIDAFINHNNHKDLEYKELAHKTKGAYQQLRKNDWFKWAEGAVLSQIQQEKEIEAQNAAERHLLEELRRKKRELIFRIFYPLLILLGVAVAIIFVVIIVYFCMTFTGEGHN